jgi:hypothetical protein
VPVLVAVTFVFSFVGNTVELNIAAAGFVVVLPVAAGLSVAQYRLYDVDRIVSRAVTYVVMSALLAGSYLAVLYVVGRTLGGLAGNSRSAAVAATLAAVAVAAPSYRHVQESVDRRFNRRRFEALQLRAAHANGDQARLQHTVQHGIGEIQVAIAELRELANGLHPTALSSSGLAGALDDLASHSPIPVTLAVTEERFLTEVETTAWFIACEAIANAVKHASPSAIGVTIESRSGSDGQGGADPTGTGLRGIADRAEALGGFLHVESDRAGGTSVHAELPCA